MLWSEAESTQAIQASDKSRAVIVFNRQEDKVILIFETPPRIAMLGNASRA